MDPFNIKINLSSKQITLTILPSSGYYKIIYYGAILGAIKLQNSQWELLKEDEIEAGDLPMFDYRKSYAADEPKITLNKQTIKKIANQIAEQAIVS